MESFLDRLLGKKQNSADNAKERLKFVLIHDRADISPGQLEMMKNDILQVISKYVDIDPAMVQINMAQDGREQRLIADIPIISQGRKKVR